MSGDSIKKRKHPNRQPTPSSSLLSPRVRRRNGRRGILESPVCLRVLGQRQGEGEENREGGGRDFYLKEDGSLSFPRSTHTRSFSPFSFIFFFVAVIEVVESR